MNTARYRECDKVARIGTTLRDIRRLSRIGRRFLSLLLVSSVMAMLGCGGDDDEGVAGIAVNTRISDPNSVFGLFAERGEEGFMFTEGLFGPNTRSFSPTVLRFSNPNFQTTPPTARFETDPSDPGESEGEGDSDGGASCNYNYDIPVVVPTIPCPLCDIVCTADDVEPGTEGPGVCFLQLAAADTPETRADPPFQSEPFDALIGLDPDGNVVTINGVSVVPDPN